MARSPNARRVKLLGFADPRGYQFAQIGIELLVPDEENFRLPTQESTLEATIAMVNLDADGLYKLASDLIAMKGSNPAEWLSVTPRGDKYVVAEGNRRLTAQRLLYNPEQLKGHVSDAEYNRWLKLSRSEGAKALPTSLFAVIGEHDAWVDRRHLGLQGGVGLAAWNPQQKARRDAKRKGRKNRTEALLDSLRETDAARFGPLEPPARTYTTFERLLDSTVATAHIGIDVDEDGGIVLRQGERSLRFLEEALKDLRRKDEGKLTSRVLGKSEEIAKYLRRLDSRVGKDADTTPMKLKSAPPPKPGTKEQPTKTGKTASKSARLLTKPKGARTGKLYEELTKAQHERMPNAAVILTRVLLELMLDEYATAKKLALGNDKDANIEAEVKAFREAVGRASITMPKSIAEALKRAATKAPTLPAKLDLVIDTMVKEGVITSKDGASKKRDLKEKEVVDLLHDAVHRLETVPSLPRVTHLHEVLAVIFNTMAAS